MSSAVNKSSKRFVPKVGSRGSSVRAPVRRNTRTSFSVPVRSDSATATPQPASGSESQSISEDTDALQIANRAEVLGLSSEDVAKVQGSAIDDVLEDSQAPTKASFERRASDLHRRLSSNTQGSSRRSSVTTSSVNEEPHITTDETPLRKAPQPSKIGHSTQVELESVIKKTHSLEKANQVNALASQRPVPSSTKRARFSETLAPAAHSASETVQQTPSTSVELKQSRQPRAPPPVQPIAQQPVRLSNLNAPRRPANAMKRPNSAPARADSVGSRGSVGSSGALRSASAAQSRPEAPPGCQIIEPEDIRDLKREERRRREAWEAAQMNLMRNMFVEKEQKRLRDEESYDETSSLRVAQATAEALTFNALKQAVMSELKEYKEKMEKQSKEKGNGEAASNAAVADAAIAGDILGQPAPLKQLINVEKFRMSDLCKDIPIGTPNEKYDDYENARVQRRRDRLLLLRAKNWKRNALKREPSEAEKAVLETVYAKFKNERLARSDKIKEESERKLKSLDDGTRTGPAPAPTLEIGQDGQIRIEHTQVDRHQFNRSNQSDSAQNKIEVDETQKTINSYSFSTKERPERWSKEETQKFYEALSAWGTDFNLIAHLFPTRSRHQIKTKFKYEERRHAIKVQMYLLNRRKANVNSYAEVSDQQIEDVKDIEEALERVRDEHEERMKVEQSAREQARAEDQEKQEHESPKRRGRDGSLPAPKRERLR